MSHKKLAWVRWIGFALMVLPFVVAAAGVGVFRMDFSHVDPAEKQKAVADAISFVE